MTKPDKPRTEENEGPLDISVVIPAFDAEEHIANILQSVEEQTARPREVVVVDSSAGGGTETVLRNWRGAIPVTYQKVESAYPGKARNIGVPLASSQWIAFLDVRTIPARDWLERCYSAALGSGAEYVGVSRTSHGDTYFKSLLLAATYGNTAVCSLSGSLILKESFLRSGGFVASVRAGEDILWMKRLAQQGWRMAEVPTPVLRYEGFPSTLGAAIRKWYIFTLSNARIDVLSVQKLLYGLLLIATSLLFTYRWNHWFAHWERGNPHFIPNLTKIYVLSLFLGYLLFRGLIRPLRKKMPFSFLLPCRWLAVWFVGMCLDLAKAPGLILGALILLRRRMTLLLSNFKNEKAPEV